MPRITTIEYVQSTIDGRRHDARPMRLLYCNHGPATLYSRESSRSAKNRKIQSTSLHQHAKYRTKLGEPSGRGQSRQPPGRRRSRASARKTDVWQCSSTRAEMVGGGIFLSLGVPFVIMISICPLFFLPWPGQSRPAGLAPQLAISRLAGSGRARALGRSLPRCPHRDSNAEPSREEGASSGRARQESVSGSVCHSDDMSQCMSQSLCSLPSRLNSCQMGPLGRFLSTDASGTTGSSHSLAT